MLFACLEQKLGSTFAVGMLLLVAFSRMSVHISNMQVIDAMLPIVNYHLIIRLSNACTVQFIHSTFACDNRLQSMLSRRCAASFYIRFCGRRSFGVMHRQSVRKGFASEYNTCQGSVVGISKAYRPGETKTPWIN